MPQISEVMTRDPYGVSKDASLSHAAQVMRDREIGDVLVLRTDGSLCGLVTDRDLVVRGLAEGLDPDTATVEEICNHEPVTLTSDQPVEEAVRTMREHDIRRLPVVDDGEVVGIVSLGDLAIERDPSSALADISRAPANN